MKSFSYKAIKKWINYLLGGLGSVAIISLIVIRLFVAWYYVIPENGMYPNFPAGSRGIGLKHPYHNASEVCRGDVILFEKDYKGQPITYIWRVVGLPGEIIEINNDALLINGKKVSHQEVRTEGQFWIYREEYDGKAYEIAIDSKLPQEIPSSIKVTVPEEHFFVMGDNRHHAIDSRSFGPIPFNTIIGRKW